MKSSVAPASLVLPLSPGTVLSPVEVLSGPALCAEYTVDTTLLWFTEEIDPGVCHVWA